MEIKHNTFTGEVEFVTYIGGDAYSAPIVFKSNGTEGKYLYLHRDYLASIVAITNESAQIVEKRMFDAWGEIVRMQDKNGNNLNNLAVLDRGYTGHEHLGTVGLIHMNGRLYDPKLHRFLQPDNNIQDPNNTQNYNRYSYVLNNPLKYSDPSGEEFTIVTGIIVGAIIAATTYTMTALLADVPFSAEGFIKSAVIGAASGAVTFGIGDYAKTISQFGSRLVFQTLAHGTSQAFFSGIQGGDPLVGLASGALSSIASSFWMGGQLAGGDGAWGGLGGKFAQSSVGTLAFGTIMGGASAKLTGGNFWQGAATGLAVTGLNHAMHKIEMVEMEKSFDREVNNAYGANADNSAPATDATLSDMRSKIPTLRRIYSGFGKKVSLNAQDKIYTASDGADAHTYVTQSGNFDDPYVMFYRASFSSYRYLAHTMLHEFGHVSSFITHNFLNNFNGNKGSFTSKWNRAIAQDELFAHQFAFRYDGIPYKNTYSWQRNYNKLH